MTIRKFGKVGVLFLALVLALGGIGAAFAAWTDTLTIGGTVSTGDLEFEILGPVGQTAEPDWNVFFDLSDGDFVHMGKDVADTTVAFPDSHTMTITIDNAYPYYYDHVSFWIHGLGSIPLKIWKVNFWVGNSLIHTQYSEPPTEYVYLDLNGDTFADLELRWGDHFGSQLHFCDSIDISFDFLVLQPAPQDVDGLSFTIEIVGIQWNEYVQGPLP